MTLQALEYEQFKGLRLLMGAVARRKYWNEEVASWELGGFVVWKRN